MPSPLHEALVRLFRDRPSLALEITDVLPDSLQITDIRNISAEFGELAAPEYRADAVTLVSGADGSPEDVLIVEVQLSRDEGKFLTWPHYSTSARLRYGCLSTIIVIAPDPSVARWARDVVPLDRAGMCFHAVVVGPDAIPFITDPAVALDSPELAVLSVVAHGDEPDAEHIAHAALIGCDNPALDSENARLYADVIFANLGAVARRALEALMESTGYTYQSDFARKYLEQGIKQGVKRGLKRGREQGEKRGRKKERRAFLERLLQQRFGALPEDVQDILANADTKTLRVYSDRLLSAPDLRAVFAIDAIDD